MWLRSLSALALRCHRHLTVALRSRQPFSLEFSRWGLHCESRLCWVYALDHAEVSYRPSLSVGYSELSVGFNNYGGLCIWVLSLGLGRRLPMVLHSLALFMWSPFGSRVCSFSIVAKEWRFLLEFHLRLIVVFQFL